MTFWESIRVIVERDVVGLRAISVRALGVRSVAVAAALVLGVSGLTACRTNVGSAATIDGHRVSESDVADYLTSSAQPLKSSDGTQSVAPKPFVVDILIRQRLYRKILQASPTGAPTSGQLTTLRRQYLAGSSTKATVERLGVKGYRPSFDSAIVDVQVLASLLNQEQQQGADLSAVLKKLRFPVSVNPRYGKWDTKNLRLVSDAKAGVPAFLRLQTASSTQP